MRNNLSRTNLQTLTFFQFQYYYYYHYQYYCYYRFLTLPSPLARHNSHQHARLCQEECCRTGQPLIMESDNYHPVADATFRLSLLLVGQKASGVS